MDISTADLLNIIQRMNKGIDDLADEQDRINKRIATVTVLAGAAFVIAILACLPPAAAG